jgi:putative DNA primase/helicase
MFARDTAFLNRLAGGQFDAGEPVHELAQLSPKFEPWARRLLSALPDERQLIWDEFLAASYQAEHDACLRVGLDGAGSSDGQEVRSNQTHARSLVIPASTGAEVGRRLRLTRAVDLTPRSVEWLWSGRVPLGMITMFAGDPKLGKSYVTLAMAAALSRGLPLPLSDQPGRPGSTILMSAEDDPARTILPRLVAGGADLVKIHILESVILASGAETLPSLRADVDAITAAAAGLGDCRLIVIDPVSAYLKGVDDNRNAALRGVLSPLNRLAEHLGAAVVLVSHLTKSGSSNGKHRVLGSIAYVGACRANFLFVADPADPTGRRVMMLDNGGNVAPPARALCYMIEDRGDGPWVEWFSESATGPYESVQSSRPEHAGQFARHRECDLWLRTFLAQGCRLPADVFAAARAAGFSKDQVRRSKSRIGAFSMRRGFSTGGQWSWGLDVSATG